MTITRVLTSDSKTVMGVVTLGLLTWAHYVGMVMEDVEEGGEEQEGVIQGEREEVQVGAQQSEGGGEERVQVIQRTKAWQNKTAENLKLLVERMCVLVTSPVWRVRLCLVGWAHSLLTRCST